MFYYRKYRMWRTIAIISILLNLLFIFTQIFTISEEGIIVKEKYLTLFFERDFNKTLIKEYIAKYINSYRKNNSLNQLVVDDTVSSYAQGWANRLLERGELKHSEPRGYLFGEIIIREYLEVSITQPLDEKEIAYLAFNWWRNSKPHNKAMLYPSFRKMGIGVAYEKQDINEWRETITIICVVQFTG